MAIGMPIGTLVGISIVAGFGGGFINPILGAITEEVLRADFGLLVVRHRCGFR
jgi:hypothetical protein